MFAIFCKTYIYLLLTCSLQKHRKLQRLFQTFLPALAAFGRFQRVIRSQLLHSTYQASRCILRIDSFQENFQLVDFSKQKVKHVIISSWHVSPCSIMFLGFCFLRCSQNQQGWERVSALATFDRSQNGLTARRCLTFNSWAEHWLLMWYIETTTVILLGSLLCKAKAARVYINIVELTCEIEGQLQARDLTCQEACEIGECRRCK